ncbi:hypothetical protein HIM_07694 [Hirsutella minnesotensis 3608]|uniref:Uncharacterized protein n=1 Tax=Hirsutella minnesotensis 3608 TaxID=1043627 RepID=A0A0F7ZHN1_9HYPO|nr:hypothetical protein HIM_07694 [Hirsutella minnesotensis 3608]
MPAIPVYTASPINASEASGVTPQTQDKQQAQGNAEKQADVASTTTSAPGAPQSAWTAQPGAGISLPVQTSMPQPGLNFPSQPNPAPSRVESLTPPAPQPGAVPMPPGKGASLPPPPKAGETPAAGQSQPPPMTMTAPPSMPPQLSYQAPTPTQPIQGRSSTTTSLPPPPGGQYPAPLPGNNPNAGYAAPAGYQQDAGASGYGQYPTPSHNLSGSQDPNNWSSSGEEQGGVWDTARKWAQAAGESLAAAEGEVWKRINKN